MTKREYLEKLARGLRPLPKEERRRQLDYYEEMLSDRMDEGLDETAAVAAMDPPETVIDRVLREYVASGRSLRRHHVGLWIGLGVVLMFVLAFWKKTDRAYLPVVILELGAVFFLIQSVLTVFPEGKSNWYLPLALALNGIALILNAVLQKQAEKQEKKNRDPEPETEVERTGAKPI